MRIWRKGDSRKKDGPSRLSHKWSHWDTWDTPMQCTTRGAEDFLCRDLVPASKVVSIDSDWGLYSGTNDWPNPAWARRPCGRSTIHEIEELLPWHAGTLLRPRKRRRPEGLAAIRCPVSHGTDGQPRTPREATRKALIAHVN